MSRFRIGDWLVHPELDRIERHGASVQLPHRVMRVLTRLAADPGEMVSKQALIDAVWDGAFTTDEVLSTTIYELRRALGDDARTPTYVETIRKRGYRLVAPVERIEAATSREHPAQGSSRPGATIHGLQGRRIGLLAGLAAALLLAAGYTAWNRAEEPDGAGALADGRQPAEISETACRAYLTGRHFLNLQTQEGLTRAIEYFTEATEVSPELAMAYTALAECYALGDWGALGLSWREARDAAFAAVATAEAIEGESSEVLAIRGAIQFRQEWDWRGAESSFVSSLSESGCAPARCDIYAEYLSATGRHAEAREQLEAYIEREPLSLRAQWGLAWVLYLAGDLPACASQVEQASELFPHEPRLPELLGDVRALQGDASGAREAVERALLLAGAPSSEIVGLRRAAATGGLAGLLDWQIARARREVTQEGVSPVRLARLEALRGDTDAVLAALERAVDERRSDVVWLPVDPAFDALRTDDRFRALVERLRVSA